MPICIQKGFTASGFSFHPNSIPNMRFACNLHSFFDPKRPHEHVKRVGLFHSYILLEKSMVNF